MTTTNNAPVFEKLLNFRDVTSLLSKPCKLKSGMIFRSARPDETTPADQQLLTSHYGIRSVIDLRSPTEHAQQLSKLSPDGSRPLAALPTVRGASYHHVNLNGNGFTRALTASLSWPAYLYLLSLYTLGYRADTVRFMADRVMNPLGVPGLMLLTLRASAAAVGSAFTDVLQRPDAYPVLLHCTQGKDRTGLMVMLVLFLLGEDPAGVKRDYEASADGLASEREQRVREIREIGLMEEWADVWVGLVEEVDAWLKSEWGGVEGYLDYAGVSREVQERVKRILLA
ncbi:protein-tyrosine phosphatase-like protein [Phyllosticta citriasiana]|uniref:Protein-tyrosine phosphatase-like protein n=1 Tax=Phyllosticta citriasiana TaxID=595635 RepID=A0ABR1KVE5_9PEZI